MSKRSPPELRFHRRSCFICRYYRLHGVGSDCLLLGRMLSMTRRSYPDRARLCDGWKRRPKNWNICADKNPYWEDLYITRETQIRLRKRLGIKK